MAFYRSFFQTQCFMHLLYEDRSLDWADFRQEIHAEVDARILRGNG